MKYDSEQKERYKYKDIGNPMTKHMIQSKLQKLIEAHKPTIEMYYIFESKMNKL